MKKIFLPREHLIEILSNQSFAKLETDRPNGNTFTQFINHLLASFDTGLKFQIRDYSASQQTYFEIKHSAGTVFDEEGLEVSRVGEITLWFERVGERLQLHSLYVEEEDEELITGQVKSFAQLPRLQNMQEYCEDAIKKVAEVLKYENPPTHERKQIHHMMQTWLQTATNFAEKKIKTFDAGVIMNTMRNYRNEILAQTSVGYKKSLEKPKVSAGATSGDSLLKFVMGFSGVFKKREVRKIDNVVLVKPDPP
jgi:hypothetical protein